MPPIVRFSSLQPTHHSPLCQANHGKLSVASWSAALSSESSDSAASGLVASSLMAFGLAVPIDGFGFIEVHDLATAGSLLEGGGFGGSGF